MTDLERIKAELERQDRGLADCFDQMRGLDPDLVIALSPEWIGEWMGPLRLEAARGQAPEQAPEQVPEQAHRPFDLRLAVSFHA